VHRENYEFSVFSRKTLRKKHNGKKIRFEYTQNRIEELSDNRLTASGGALTENVSYDITSGHEKIALERSQRRGNKNTS
jgi:hypothetical protein